MNKILLTCAFALCSFWAMADDEITTVDASKVARITFDGDQVNLRYQGSTTVTQYDMDKVMIVFTSTATKGDANSDGSVDIADAVAIVNHVVGKENPTFIEDAADANNDGAVDIADAVHIINLVVGKISTLHQETDSTQPNPE